MEDSSVDVAFRGTASHPQTTRRTTETGIDEPEAAGLTGPPSSAGPNVVCDGCDERIMTTRHKCIECPDFDFCPRCYLEAPLVHPGHSFVQVRNGIGLLGVPGQDRDDITPASDPEQVESIADVVVEKVGPFECRSCASVTGPLPALTALLNHKSIIKSNGGVPPRKISFEWPLRISRLIEATQKGCAFCAFVLHKFFGPSNVITFQYHPKRPWYAEPRKHDKERTQLVEHCMGSLAKLQHDRFGFSAEPICRRTGSSLPDFDSLRISVSNLMGRERSDLRGIFNSAGVLELITDVYAGQDDPAGHLVSHRPPNSWPGSDRGMKQAKIWLEECVRNHGDSCGSSGADLPSRVIDVSQDTLRLYQTSPGENGRYAALSYCWGGPQPYMTTTATLPARISGFQVGDLPKTLQDAVAVTRQLEIRYLWVDAMCIVQDSVVDKAHEVSCMATVYRNAHVTICASSASSADSGFLQDFSDPETASWGSLVPLAFPIPNKDAESVKDILGMPRTDMGTIWLLDEDESFMNWDDPASKRAWCLQERVLSPRFLSYGRWPTWRCSRATRSDGGFFLEQSKSGPDSRKLTDALLKRTSTGGTDLFTIHQLQRAWYKLLNDYSKREIGIDADRLPAIGGIAAAISRISGVGYVAGLWQNNILYDLMWYADTREWLSRPPEWRAPSWSWASVNAPVEYGRIADDATPLATVRSCESLPAPEHGAFGEVVGGTLEISGPFAEVAREDVLALFRDQKMAPSPPKSNNVSEWYAQILEHCANQPKNQVSDEAIQAALPDRVFALLTFVSDWRMKHETRKEETCYSGLLLREIEGGNFERISAFTNEVTAWLGHSRHPWTSRTVTLV